MIENYFMMNIGNHIDVAHIILRVIVSLLIGTAIGEERESKNRPAGLRTHILVSLAAATIAILECEIVYIVGNLNNPNINVSVGRLSVGVVSGIGFLGAGTIMMLKNKITGLTTAASLWCTAALGLAAGMGYFSLAVLGTLMAIGILEGMAKLSRKYKVQEISVKYKDNDKSSDAITNYYRLNDMTIVNEALHYQKETETTYCIQTLVIKMPTVLQLQQVCKSLLAIEGVIEVTAD